MKEILQVTYLRFSAYNLEIGYKLTALSKTHLIVLLISRA